MTILISISISYVFPFYFRSYLFGNINSGISLLGSEELHRYFPDRKVKMFVGTWNMGGHKVSNYDYFKMRSCLFDKQS